jgi:hypothetical protein
MLHLLHDKNLPEAFNVSKEEKDTLTELLAQLVRTKGVASATWTIERLWIDEQFSDNLKAMAIFMLGYSYAVNERGKNGGDSTNGLTT